MRFFSLLVFLPIVCLSGLSCARENSAQDPIRIGMYGPFSGALASYGTQVRSGALLAVEEINRNGGVLGRQLQLIAEDDRGNPEEAQNAVTRLITKEQVVAVIGEATSSGSLAGAPVCQQTKTPMITPTATNPKVTQVGDYIFRVCWTDPFQGASMAQFALNNLKARRIAVLFDVSSDYSVGIAEVFSQTVTDAGGEIILRASYSSGDTDFVAQLTSIKNAKPDALFIPGYYTDAGLIVRQARTAGLTCPLIGADGWDSPELWRIAGEALQNSFYFGHFHLESPNPQVRAFVGAYEKKYAEFPSTGSALAYDAVGVLAEAFRSAGTTDPSKVRDAIASVENFSGVTGNITMGASRDAVKPGVVLRIDGGKIILVQTIAP